MREFNGKIELDIRDSEPDWGPYQAPVAPPGVAERPVPGLGRHRHRHVGLLRRPRRDARDEPASPNAACGSRSSTPPRCARRPGRRCSPAATRPPSGWPPSRSSPTASQLQRPHPRRHRAAVRGARRARLQHLLRRQVAPHAARGIQSRCHQTALAAEPRVRAVLRLHGRRDRPVVSRAGLRQPSRRPARHPARTATTCRRTWRTRPSSSSATRR